jgi:hypothetical protein
MHNPDHRHTPAEERAIREAALDETIEGTFPASDSPSSIPNPDDHGAVPGEGDNTESTTLRTPDRRPIHSDSRTLLVDLRKALLHLHKRLLEWERRGYERIHGRQSNSDLLDIILEDAQFAWLRPMSQLIVRIDQILEENTPPMINDLHAVVAHSKALTAPDANGGVYARRYDTALQEDPDVIFAHRDLVALLKSP